MSEITSLHRKYRPETLSTLIGHESVVTRLQGIVKSGKYPNALLFIGPSSAGKTTLARAFAAEVNGVESFAELGSDYVEINCTDKRSIDDVRQIIQQAKYRPRKKKRVIVMDEFQGLLGNAQAAAALLKPLEEPSKDTIWVLCTMDPSRLGTGNGKALSNRCTQFVLDSPSEEALTKQAQRIIKGEGMKYATKLVETVVQHSNQEMRTLANVIESLQQYYEGLDKKPKTLKPEDVVSVFESTESNDEDLAVQLLTALYTGQFAKVQRCLLDVADGVRFMNLLLQGNSHLMNLAVLGRERHPKVEWWSKVNKGIGNATSKMSITLGTLAAVNERLVQAKAQIHNFTVTPQESLSAHCYRIIKDIFAAQEPEEQTEVKKKKSKKAKK